ncbi:MAG: hypothetical protein VYE04_17715 [Pseudomonadota bacterium]|nr:hypothetical protein [Pseudomonadota bacterium]
MDLPVAWANYISIAGFLLLGIIVWAIPRALIFAEASDKASWRDIRIWATVLIGIQLSLYLIFT